MSALFTADYIHQSGLTGRHPEESNARFCLILNMEAALCFVTEVQGKQGLVNVTHLLKDTSVVGKYVSMSVRVWTVCTVILSHVSDLAFWKYVKLTTVLFFLFYEDFKALKK